MREQNNHITPPKWPLRLLRFFIKAEYLEEVEGDMEERFYDNMELFTSKKASRLYSWDTLKLIRPSLIRGMEGGNQLNQFGMFKNYFKIGYRNLLRNRWYSLVNILGLSVGMGVCLLITQYIWFELSYDKFHDNYKHVYRIIIGESDGGPVDVYPHCSRDLGVIAKEEIPEVKEYARKHWFSRGGIVTNPVNNSSFHKESSDLLFVDDSFLRVFNFPLKSGNRESPFTDQYSILITEKISEKYFGSNNPIGKTLLVNAPIISGTYTVTGVLEDLPLNSHMQFDFLIPIENFIEHGWGGAVKKQGGWNGFSTVTYLAIDPSADLNLVGEKLEKLLDTHEAETSITKSVSLQPIEDIYMKSDSYRYPGYFNTTGNIENVKVFAIISVFILLLAWVNYINLSTARAMHRAREVGIRKSIGALRKQLIIQFVLESVLINALASAIAIAVAFLLLPVLAQIIGKEVGMSMLKAPAFWFWFCAVVFSGSLLSGIYPAFILSNVNPVSLLGTNVTSGTGNVGLRRGLIVFQFGISLLLVSATYMIYKQTTFMKNQELGVDIEKILVIRGPQIAWSDEEGYTRFETFKNEMIRHHSISGIAGSMSLPGQFGGGNNFRKVGDPVDAAPYSRDFTTGVGFPEAYGLEFVAGSSFREGMSDEHTVIINEEAIRTFGFDTPEDAINEQLMDNHGQLHTIVGVVKNFHWHSLAEAHTAYVISLYNTIVHQYISLRMNLSDIHGSLAHIESVYRNFFPGKPFEYIFAEEAYYQKYQSEIEFGKLFSAFSALAIFIACIGLLALVSYSTKQRTKEIGVRKVLGASISDLVILLSKEYLILLIITLAVTVPIVFYGGNQWLDNYANRINLALDIFIVPGFALVIISILTVSHRTFTTAKSNPVESLRNE